MTLFDLMLVYAREREQDKRFVSSAVGVVRGTSLTAAQVRSASTILKRTALSVCQLE